MKRALIILVALIAVAAIGAFGVSYFLGSLRVQREAAAYLEALESCTPFDQQAWAPLLKATSGRSVVGPSDRGCDVTIAALGAGQLRCSLDDEGLALMVRYIEEGVETVTFLGGQTASIRYSSETPDPMTELMNGSDCTFEP